MRWFITGGHGMLATDLVSMVLARHDEVVAVDRDDLDITDFHACADGIRDIDVVVNCAAFTAVDAAETQEAEAFAINALGAANVAAAAHAAGARTIQVSTDYVFDGTARVPYAEGAPFGPRSAYGRTKAAGEWGVRAADPQALVVRTAWLYGAHGGNFPRTISRVAAERGSVDVVDDQVGQPTWTVDLARLIVDLVAVEAPPGTYHGTSEGSASWFDFAQAVVGAAGMDPGIVRAVSSEAFVRPAARPEYSCLGKAALEAVGVEPIGPWDERWTIASGVVLGGDDV